MKLLSEELVQKFTQTPGVRNEIDKILTPILLTQKMYGQQILDPCWSWRNNFLNHICILTITIYVLLGTCDFIQKNDNYELFIEAIFTLIIIFEVPTKSLFFIHYRNNFHEVYSTAKTLLFNIVNEISPQKRQRVVDRVRKMVMGIIVMTVVPIMAYLLIAFWLYFNGTRVPLSRTTSILMPMTSPYYEIGLIIHLNYLIMAVFLIIVVDFWFILLTYFFCEACESTAKILEVERLKEETDILYANRLNEALRIFFALHVKLMQYLNTLNDVYKWPLLVPLSTVLITTCLLLLVISEEINWQLVIAMVPSTVQMFAYNLLGEAVKTKTSDMTLALINFDWTSMKLQDRKSYSIIVCYMNKEFGVRTAVGFDLSLLTLSSLYKGSYQFFAVLNTMKN